MLLAQWWSSYHLPVQDSGGWAKAPTQEVKHSQCNKINRCSTGKSEVSFSLVLRKLHYVCREGQGLYRGTLVSSHNAFGRTMQVVDGVYLHFVFKVNPHGIMNVRWRETYSALKPYKSSKRQQRDAGDLIYLKPDHFWGQKMYYKIAKLSLSCWRIDPVLSDLRAAVIDRIDVTLANMLLTFVCSVASSFCPSVLQPDSLCSWRCFTSCPKRLLQS